MKICMFTNTFLPHVGGVARSVQTFAEDYRNASHRVLIVAPEFSGGPVPRRIERHVVRVPALQNFNDSDFSVRLPLGTAGSERLSRFRAEIVHTHHPFLLGDTALRIAAQRGVPAVFTHHTLYEQYTHYVPFDSEQMKQFVIELSTRFANCCQGVIAPSESVAAILRKRGVTAPVAIVPTGIDTRVFAKARRTTWRRRLRLKKDEILLGHVGRLAQEKNLQFLTDAVAACLTRRTEAHMLVVGDGPSREAMQETFQAAGVADRVHFVGKLSGSALRNAYAAMDVFVFSSHSETQGMVVAEAMAAGLPVVALDANGVREVVRDDVNGALLPADAEPATMADALDRAVRDAELRERWSGEARRTAEGFDRSITAAKALSFYEEVIERHQRATPPDERDDPWHNTLERAAIEGRLLADKLSAAIHAMGFAGDRVATGGTS